MCPSCSLFHTLDNRPFDTGNDGAVSDSDHRLPHSAGRLPEDPVYTCDSGWRGFGPTAAHPVAGGAGCSGKSIATYIHGEKESTVFN